MADVIDGAYLSQEACTALRIIPSNPRIGSDTQQPMSVSLAAASPPDEECDCFYPNCSTIPDNWLQPGRSSELDTRQRPVQHIQQLRNPNSLLMEGLPFELHIGSDAKPIAVHKPIPVPLHWPPSTEMSNPGLPRLSQWKNQLSGVIE